MKTIYVAVSENDRRLIIDGSFDLLDAFLQVIQGDRTERYKPIVSVAEIPLINELQTEVQHETE